MNIELTPDDLNALLDHLAFSYTAAQQDSGILWYYRQDVTASEERQQQALELSKKLYAILEETK